MVLCMRLFRSLLLVLSLSLLSMSKVFSPSFLEGVSLLHYQLLSREVLCSQKRRYFLRFREHEAEVERETRATEEDACLKNAKKMARVLRATMKFRFPKRSHFLSGS